MKLTRIISLVLCTLMLLSVAVCAPFSVAAQNTALADTAALENSDALYAYVIGTDNAQASEAVIKWAQKEDTYYFYLTSNVNNSKVVLFNGFSQSAKIADTTISAGESKEISFNTTDTYTASVDGNNYNVKFMVSTAESSIFVNGTAPDGGDLFTYLSENKENSVAATGAIVDADGKVDFTPVKKIKGRGNTTWDKDKKPFNVTYDSAVSIGGMSKGKKWSLLANYQDSSLSRNRFLYDLSDAVGMPYASDSRYVDFYMNGVYMGSYQVAQKVDTGSKELVNDIDPDAYMTEDGALATDFPFLLEVDASAGDTDYWVKSSSGNKLTLKGPEIDYGDPYYNEVLAYAKAKFDAMFTAVKTGSDKMGDLVDLDSLAKIYLINELSKNWDVGVSSLYFVYKQDTNGKYKFFASPVWDYDNSLGNATGVGWDLDKMGVSDYEEYTGWWVKKKLDTSGNKPSSTRYYNIMGIAAKNETFMAKAAQVWFEQFVPVLESFASTGVSTGEMYSHDVYYQKLVGSANMNYASGWLLNTGDWICDHSSITKATYNYKTQTYTVASTATRYDGSFEAEYNYAVDWMLSRSAWLSNELQSIYVPTSDMLGDIDFDGEVSILDATLIQKSLVKMISLTDRQNAVADFNKDGVIDILDVTTIQKFLVKMEY